MDNSPSEQSPSSFLLNEELCKRQADHIQPYLKTESRNEERVISEVHTEEQSDITRVSGDPNLLQTESDNPDFLTQQFETLGVLLNDTDQVKQSLSQINELTLNNYMTMLKEQVSRLKLGIKHSQQLKEHLAKIELENKQLEQKATN